MGSYRIFQSEDLAPVAPTRGDEERGLLGTLPRSCSHYIFVVVGIIAMSFISWGQLTMWSEISSLREEVDILKLHVLWYSADIDLATFMQQQETNDSIHRAKRSPQFGQEGGSAGAPKPPVFDFPYASGNDVNQHDSASSLMKYDSLMHGRNGHQSSQSQQSWTGEDTIEGQRVQQRMQSQSQGETTSGEEALRHAGKSAEDKSKWRQMSAYARRVNAHRMLRTSYTPAAAAEGAASTADFSDNFISRSPASTTEESPVLRSRPITKSLTSATNSIQLVGDADKVKKEAKARATSRDVAKSRVALHLFETQSTRPSDPLGSVGGWQRSVESGATATGVDEDGRVIVPEDGLYLLYAQVRYRADNRHGPTNAYEVYHGADPILTCSKSAEAASEQSCFTARILLARRGDALSLRDKNAGNRISIDSFLGIVKL